ncbi:hypothetical protein M747DRAFT_43004 [Aspergillus niger ATCC 13496]|uniref:Uncharacterized protein n=1 Tax=Aspergillus niger ATCC 13496 TaxID=1353008 RepID=A0A370BXX5_ASPNG|nr:hypothetical protein M747DRAFT_43004 [Aspergillus niger ATCC 13496]
MKIKWLFYISHFSYMSPDLRGNSYSSQPADPVRTDHGVCFGSLVHDTMAPLYLSNLILVSNLRGISLPYQPAGSLPTDIEDAFSDARRYTSHIRIMYSASRGTLLISISTQSRLQTDR